MANVLEIIKNEITQDYYKNNFPNDGQRFVAWYMRNIHLLDQRQAKDAITDGANDKQIDAVYIDEDEQKIYIVQGKYYLGESVDATPVREVISAWSQFSNLTQLQENANSKLKTKISEIATALEDDSYCVCFELITTSIFTDAAMDDIHSFQTKLSEEDDAELNYSTQFSVVDKLSRPEKGLQKRVNLMQQTTNSDLSRHYLPRQLRHLILQEYLSGVKTARQLSEEHGIPMSTIHKMGQRWKAKNSCSFVSTPNPYPIMSRVTSEEASELLSENKALRRRLEEALLRLEGYEIMGDILQEEYGIDLLKKSAAGQSSVSKKDTQQ